MILLKLGTREFECIQKLAICKLGQGVVEVVLELSCVDSIMKVLWLLTCHTLIINCCVIVNVCMSVCLYVCMSVYVYVSVCVCNMCGSEV